MAVNLMRQRLFDSLAISASTVCLVHCLVLPLLLVLVPTLAAFLTIPESFHLWALAFAVPTSLLALGLGYRRHHQAAPGLIALAGLGFLAAGVFLAPSEILEMLITVLGSTLLSVGHVLNWRSLGHGKAHGH